MDAKIARHTVSLSAFSLRTRRITSKPSASAPECSLRDGALVHARRVLKAKPRPILGSPPCCAAPCPPCLRRLNCLSPPAGRPWPKVYAFGSTIAPGPALRSRLHGAISTGTFGPTRPARPLSASSCRASLAKTFPSPRWHSASAAPSNGSLRLRRMSLGLTPYSSGSAWCSSKRPSTRRDGSPSGLAPPIIIRRGGHRAIARRDITARR